MKRLALLALLTFIFASPAPPAHAQSDDNSTLSVEPEGTSSSNGKAAAAITLERVVKVQPQGYAQAQRDGTGLPSSLSIPTGNGASIRLDFTPETTASPSVKVETRDSRLPWILIVAIAVVGLSGVIFWRPAAKAPAPIDPMSAFAINRVIGRGGMGIVYEAVDRSLDRKVALKKMRDDLKRHPSELEKFVKEAKTVAQLRHPNIVAIHSVVSQGDETFLVFEYVEGKTVECILDEARCLTLDQARALLGPVCQALDYAHGRRVIHRDLKPSNVMVTTEGQVKVMDFGIARRIKESVYQCAAAPVAAELTNTVWGTPTYMGPEAQQGMISPEGDIYALGVMLYELLAGVPPFPPEAKWDERAKRAFVPLSKRLGLSENLDRLVADALEPDPAKRIHSAAEFWNRLASA